MKKRVNLIIALAIVFFNILLIIYPSDVLSAAREGFSLWWGNVLPALLPFMIGTNILMGLGFVRFVGTLLEPAMVPLFGVPGCGGYAFVTGVTSGYPVGAKTVSGLLESGELTQTEAQRLLSFCNNAGPLFLLGAVGAGMFRSVQAGYFLMLCHYAAALLTGLLFKYYRPAERRGVAHTRQIFSRALSQMHEARQKDGRPFGAVLGDSVKNAMETIILVGGFIIFFCVIVKMLEVTQLMPAMLRVFGPMASVFGIEPSLMEGFFIGLIEVTNGSRALAALEKSKAQMLFVGAIVSFGGFSIFAQTVSLIAHTDLSRAVYLLSKVIHSGLTVLLGFFLFPFFNWKPLETGAVPANMTTDAAMLEKLAFSSGMFGMGLLAMFVFAAFMLFGMACLRRL